MSPEEIYDDCLKTYKQLLSIGVCAEQARMVLPQSMYTSYYVTGSLSAFARAYKLRIDKHAQREIQELAESWNNIIKDLFPVSWKAVINEE
jgi:thymidylate synthase (FAD)